MKKGFTRRPHKFGNIYFLSPKLLLYVVCVLHAQLVRSYHGNGTVTVLQAGAWSSSSNLCLLLFRCRVCVHRAAVGMVVDGRCTVFAARAASRMLEVG